MQTDSPSPSLQVSKPSSTPDLPDLLATKTRLEEVIKAQPGRKRQLAKQIAHIQSLIDAAQGQALLF